MKAKVHVDGLMITGSFHLTEKTIVVEASPVVIEVLSRKTGLPVTKSPDLALKSAIMQLANSDSHVAAVLSNAGLVESKEAANGEG